MYLCSALLPALQLMIVNGAAALPFGEYTIWGNDAGPDYLWDEAARAFVPTAYQEAFVQRLDEPGCTVKGCRAGTLPSQVSREIMPNFHTEC
jgi:hypothetical protein